MSLRTRLLSRGLREAGLALAALLCLTVSAGAQQFGRNKVQYDDFDWLVLHTTHYKIHFYPEERELVQDAARMAERWNARLSREFQHNLSEVKPIIFYADHPDFEQTNAVGGLIDVGTGGVTEPLMTRLIMPFSGIYKEDDHVLGHEMAHVFQFDVASARGGGGLAAMERLPLWMIEGMAEYLSKGRDDPLTALWMRDAALRGDLPSLKELSSPTYSGYLAYRYGEALWAFIGGKWGDRAVTDVYRFALREGPEGAIRRVLGVTSAQLGQQWITAVREEYLPLIQGRTRPDDAGKRVLGEGKVGDNNLGPVLSPDGRYVAFFGVRSLFSIDLLLADAHTGKIIRHLTSPLNDPHFDAISFINSAGSWSPDGKRFAFIVDAEGNDQIAIVDVASGNIERNYEIKGVGEVNSPAWSPDGTRIAFSGSAGGISDLYMLDMGSGQVTQLTNDKYGDLDPDWSPDGRTLAFATDRSEGTDFRTLKYEPLHIALFDVSTHQVRLVPGFAGATHINPQFSPDGKSIYYVANPDGFQDVYRTDLGTGQIYQVTRLATGVSGNTDLSPAITVASQSGDLMFTAFQNSGFDVYSRAAADAQGTPVTTTGPQVAAGVLPPVQAMSTSLVMQYLRDAETGLPPADTTFAVNTYHPGLALEYIGQPTLGVGTSSFGTMIGGGASAYFGDLLGNRTLGVAVQANGQVQDIGGQFFYENSAKRWNWAGVAGHIPYLTGYTDIVPTTGSVNGIPADGIIRQHLLRVYVDQAGLLTQYPISQTRRWEFSGQFTRYSYGTELRQFFLQGNSIIGEQQLKNDTTAFWGNLQGLSLVQASAAFVGDYSYFGFTSPVAGGRYRFEATPTTGTYTFTTLYGDYRHYFFFQPFTFAIRGLEFGRYFENTKTKLAEESNGALQPLFLGYPTLVRGYEYSNFSGAECTGSSSSSNSCPQFNRLFGSRIAVANLELRVPLFGVQQYGLIKFPFLPTDLSAFVNGGVAWGLDNTGPVKFEFARNTEDHVPVFSTGVSARFNILGYLIGEVYWAYPFQRPVKGGHFGFQIAPGW